MQFIFDKNKGIPTSAAARITRWAITLSGYMYDIQYKKGCTISNADGLSRLPCHNKTEIQYFIYSFNLVNEIPFSSERIAKETSKELVLLKVKDFAISGWPNSVYDENLKPFFKRENELSMVHVCILLGNKTAIPISLQKEVLNLFHEQHIGGVRTKC